ncbi:GNAT family N-acetyltransferase [bacterium]|nr:GNAT family N-acetyltransferase [bacterium]
MQIENLSDSTLPPYLACLEEWSDDIREAGGRKAAWLEKMKNRGLKVKVAVEDGETVGMIQAVPIEQSQAEGKNLYFIHCIWVHGHKGKGVGDRRGRGIGKAMLSALEEDVRTIGAKGMAAWGLALPFWMRASWFRKQGYRKADRDGMAVLVWKPFAEDAEAPRWIRRKKTPGRIDGKVAVDAFVNGWCNVQNTAIERARRAAATFGDRAEFRLVDTSERPAFLEWGLSDALFIDGKPVRIGPPPSYEKIRRAMEKRINKLPRH